MALKGVIVTKLMVCDPSIFALLMLTFCGRGQGEMEEEEGEKMEEGHLAVLTQELGLAV